jgi:hypothetical protein
MTTKANASSDFNVYMSRKVLPHEVGEQFFYLHQGMKKEFYLFMWIVGFNHPDEDFPSLEEMSCCLGWSRSTIRQSLKLLVKISVLTAKERIGYSTIYRINPEAFPALAFGYHKMKAKVS